MKQFHLQTRPLILVISGLNTTFHFVSTGLLAVISREDIPHILNTKMRTKNIFHVFYKRWLVKFSILNILK